MTHLDRPALRRDPDVSCVDVAFYDVPARPLVPTAIGYLATPR